MDINTLKTIISVSCIVVFVLIILGLIISIIVGIKKKVVKATFDLFFMGTLVIIALFLVQTISNLLMTINLVPMIGSSFNLSMNGSSVVVAVGTVKETLVNTLKGFCELNKIAITTSLLTQIDQLSILIMNYATFMAELIIILILGSLLDCLLWHLCFKHFIPTVVRRLKKLRWLAMLENMTKYIIVGGLFIASGTSLINTVNQAWKKANIDTSGNETLQIIDSALSTYDNSILGKLFSWTADANGVTMDTALVNSFISTTVNNYSSSVLDLVNELSSIASTVAGGFKISSSVTVDLTYLTSVSTVYSFLNALNNSNIIYSLLPTALEVAMNSEFIKSFMATEDLHLEGLNWDEEMKNIENLVYDLSSSNLFHKICPDGDISHISVTAQDVVQYCLEDTSFSSVYNALTEAGESDLLSQVINAVTIYQIQNNPQVAEYIKIPKEELLALDWTYEFDVLLSSLYEINKAVPEFIPTLFNSLKSPSNEAGGSSNDTKDILQVIVDNYYLFSDVMLGQFDRYGNAVNIDDYGISIGEERCLFDSHLILGLLPGLRDKLVKLLTDNFTGTIELDSDAIKAAFDSLCLNSRAKNFKEEFYVMFDVLFNLFEYQDLLQNFSFDALKSLSDYDINVLATTIENIDSSKLLESVLPSITEMLFTSPEIVNFLDQYNLSYEDFNFEPKDVQGNSTLGLEMGYIFRNIKSIISMAELSEGGFVLTDLHEYYLDIANMLDVFFTSEILNPYDKFYDGDTDNAYFNMLKALIGDGVNKGIIDMEGIYFNPTVSDLYPYSHGAGVHQWSDVRDEYGSFITDIYGNAILNGENGFIANIIYELTKEVVLPNGTHTDIITLAKNGYDFGANISVLESDKNSEFQISSFLNAIDSSTIFSRVIGGFLDNNLSNFVDVKNGFSFTNVVDWSAEGINFKNLIKSIKILDINLTDFDFNKITNFEELNILLHHLANSGAFNSDTNGYSFNIFIYSKITSMIGSDANKYIMDPHCDELSPTFNMVQNDFNIEPVNDYYISYTDKDMWCSEDFDPTKKSDPSFFTSDEIGRISYSLKYINEQKKITETKKSKTYTDIFAFLSSGDATSAQMMDMLTAFNECDCLRMVLYNTLRMNLENISFEVKGEVISLDIANIDYLVYNDTTKAMRRDEISVLKECFIPFERLTKLGEISFATLINHKESLVNFYNALEAMDRSNIMQLAGPSIGYEITMFQKVFSSILGLPDIEKLFFSTTSPKDSYHITNNDYLTSKEKALYVILDLFPYSNPSLDQQRKDIKDFSEAFSTISAGYCDVDDIVLTYDDDFNLIDVKHKSDPSLPLTIYSGLKDKDGNVTSDFEKVDLTKITTEDVYTMIYNLNESSILFDTVPNGLKFIFESLKTSMFSMVDFTNAEFYYSWLNSDGTFNVNKENNKMADDEIMLISCIVDDSNKIKDVDFKHMSTWSQEYLNQLTLDLENLVDDLYNSYSMHLFDAVRYQDQYDLTKLTVLESFMRSLYKASGLSTLAYNASVDTSFISADEKLVYNIKQMTQVDNSHQINPVGYSSTWNEEYDSIKVLMNDAYPLIHSLEDGQTLSDIKFELTNPLLTPTFINTLMTDLNKVDVIKDSVPNLLSDIFDKAKFNEFSKYNGNDIATYYLTQKEFTEGSNPELANIYNLLDAFSIKSGGVHQSYYEISGTFDYDDMIAKGCKPTELVRYGYNSNFYDKDNGLGFTTHGLYEYNLFKKASVENYVLGTNELEKIKVVDKDLTFISDINLECESFNSLFKLAKTIGGIPSFDPEDIETIKALKLDLYKAMISTTNVVDETANDYVKVNSSHDRTYLSSEILAGVLQKFIDKQIDDVYAIVPYVYEFRNADFPTYACFRLSGNNTFATSADDLTSNSYNLISLEESKALYAMISLSEIDLSGTVTRDNPDFRNLGFINCFELMDLTTHNSELALPTFANNMYREIMNRYNYEIYTYGHSDIPPTSLQEFQYYQSASNPYNFKAYGITLANALGF